MADNPISKTYTIQEIGKMYDIPASTLRYYEDLGLLLNVGRTPANKRIYTEEHTRRLDGVMCFKRTGMSVAKIKEFYDYERDVEGNIDAIVALVKSHEREILDKIEELSKDLSLIREKVDRYTGIQAQLKKTTKGNNI